MENIIINEASNNKKKYKCMYCNYRGTRNDLVRHINRVHKELIPKGYTATRLVFNMINNKDHGTCVMCGKESPWNEDKGRYDRFCGSKKCHDDYVKKTHKVTDIANRLKDPEFQKKALKGRGISGDYKFSNGVKLSYTGSYEKNFLEFMDKFMKVSPYDLQAPGPVIDYIDENGEKRKWITDYYYIPYNLVFDIKDGGDNPNTRDMPIYRAKQEAKEKAIVEQGKYNYIRLTDNNFEQLISIMIDIKDTLMDNEHSDIRIVHINEGLGLGGPAGTAIVSQWGTGSVYVRNRLKNNVFSGTNPNSDYDLYYTGMDKKINIKNGKMKLDSIYTMVNESYMDTFVLNRSMDNGEFIKVMEQVEDGVDLYTALTGNKLLDSNQLELDTINFTRSLDNPITEMINHLSIMESTILESNKIMNIDIPPLVLENYNNGITLERDFYGVYYRNNINNTRTRSCESINELSGYLDLL